MKNGRILAITVIVIIIAVAIWGAFKPNLAPTLNLVLLAGLIAVTMLYAYSTEKIARASKEQADASVKMAEEMREARYDAVRPVIDIQEREGDAATALSVGLAAERGDFPGGLSCKLHNIGLGPAIDVYSFIQGANNEQRCWDFGTLAKDQKTDKPKSLSINKKGDQNYMAVYYKDVFGLNFESSREVKLTKEKTGFEIGPLKTVLVKESKPK